MAVLDKGYDAGPIYDAIEERGIRPVIPLMETEGVKQGWDKPPSCIHGEWVFAGSDPKRGASKWRCPSPGYTPFIPEVIGQNRWKLVPGRSKCEPASTWVKASRLHPLIPRNTPRWKSLYHQRGAIGSRMSGR